MARRMRVAGATRSAVLALAILPIAVTALGQSVDSPLRIERTVSDVTLKPDGTLVQIGERLIKVQTQAGVQQAGQVPYPYSHSRQRFSVIEAYTQKADGRRLSVASNAIFIQEAPQSSGAPMFSDIKVAVLVYPDVAVGDRIYAKVRYEEFAPLLPPYFSFLRWTAPHGLVDEAGLTLHVPAAVTVQVDREGYGEERTVSGGTVTYRWTASNTVDVPFEEGSIHPLDYSKHLAVSTIPDYPALARAFWNGAREKAEPTPAVRALADEVTAGVSDPREQARRLYDWVRTNVRYVAISLGAGAVVPHSASEVLTNRYGDCKDMVMLLTSLLAAKGIQAQAALINSGPTFWVSKVPVLDNFDHLIAYVPALQVWADPTAVLTPFGRLPEGVQGKTVVLIPSGELLATPVDRSADNVTSRKVRYEIREDGTIHGTTSIAATGARAEQYRYLALVLPPDQAAEVVREQTTNATYEGRGTIALLRAALTDESTELRVEYVLTRGGAWPGSGTFSVPEGFGGFEAISGFSAPRGPNRWPVFAGARETLIEEYEIVLPPRMKVVGLPPAVSFSNARLSYESTVRQSGQVVYVTRTLVDRYDGLTLQPGLFTAREEADRVLSKDLRAVISYAFDEASTLTSSSSPAGPTTPEAGIVKRLVDAHSSVQVPASGKLKLPVSATTPRFDMPEGETPVVLLQLPDYRAPYTLVLSSAMVGLLNKRVFVPTVVVFDSGFRRVRLVSDSEFERKSGGWTKGPRLEVSFSVAEANRNDRYLLIYTQRSQAKQPTALVDKVQIATGVLSDRAIGRAVDEGLIEVESKPATAGR